MTPTKPPSLTVLAWLFIAIGSVTIFIDLLPLATGGAAEWAELTRHWATELAPAWAIRACAIAGGVLMLQGVGWARWVLTAWIVFHVAISATSIAPLVVHSLIGVIAVYIMFRRPASDYFRG